MYQNALLAGLLAVGSHALPQGPSGQYTQGPWRPSSQVITQPATSVALGAPTGTASVVPVQTGGSTKSSTGSASGYKCFKGIDFPAQSEWLTYDNLVKVNGASLHQGNSDTIYNAIISDANSVATAAGIPPEIILAQIMQESGGKISAVTDGGKSIGLMQVEPTAQAPVRCDSGNCTPDVVLGMIQQGVNGHTGTGAPVAPGTAYYLKQGGGSIGSTGGAATSNGTSAGNVGAALREYNSGHLPDPNDYSVATAKSTQSYVSDVANRLLGLSPESFPTPSQLLSQCGFQIPDTSG